MWLKGGIYWERWFSSLLQEFRILLKIKSHSQKSTVFGPFISWLRCFTRIHEKSSVFHTVHLLRYSYHFYMILIRIENCILSIGVLRNKHQVTVRKFWSIVKPQNFDFSNLIKPLLNLLFVSYQYIHVILLRIQCVLSNQIIIFESNQN